MIELKPIRKAPDPRYPDWDLSDPPTLGVGRRAAATATVTLALCFSGGCSGSDEESSGQDASTQIVTVESGPQASAKAFPLPEVRSAGSQVDLGQTMDGTTLGMPLALGLSPEERAPRQQTSHSAKAPVPPFSAGSQPVLLALADKPKEDEHIQDNDVVRPKKLRPKNRKVRMSGCSRMTNRRRR